MKIRPVAAELFHADEQTDRDMTKLVTYSFRRPRPYGVAAHPYVSLFNSLFI
jgi:hypothetical protein